MTARSSRAFVSLVGAGPGDVGLLTLRGQQALQQADVVLYDYLANPELLRYCPQAERISVGKKGFADYIKQPQIDALIVQKALENGGQRVVRLKGGDVFVFGRGGEEAQACVSAGIPFEVVPGVSSAIAAPAYAGIPVTHRGVARSFAVLTGSTKEGRAHFASLASVDTLVLMMSVRHLHEITADLIAVGRSPDLPAATIEWGSTAQQRVATGTLGTIARLVEEQGLQAPAVTVVGNVVALRETLHWFTPPQQAMPLRGRTVAVTRTRDGASTLAGLLAQRGANVLEVPLIRFTDTADEAALHAKLADLGLADHGGVDWLVLSSNQGVAALFTHLGRLGLDARHLAGVKVATVGPSTARSLAAHGVRADFVPSSAGAKYLGAELPAQPAATQPAAMVLHLTSQAAEATLERSLAARGIRYARAEAYRTEVADLSPAEQRALSEVDAVTLASGSAARHLAALAGTNFKVVAMGPQTADAAREAGFSQITVAQTASLEALADAVAQSLNDAD